MAIRTEAGTAARGRYGWGLRLKVAPRSFERDARPEQSYQVHAVAPICPAFEAGNPEGRCGVVASDSPELKQLKQQALLNPDSDPQGRLREDGILGVALYARVLSRCMGPMVWERPVE